MLLSSSLLAALAALHVAAQGPRDTTIFSGRNRQVDVRVPQLNADVEIDGRLDEPIWRKAALLTGFSLYQPVDQRPSPDSTEVLVWYSPTAMYFGIRAFEPHGPVRATLADRDRVSSDDNVEIHLDTFKDKRRAFVFIVNALGVQADGTKSEGGGFIPGANVMPGMNDLSPDFVWQSKGRVTESGYEVEVRIPFRSLRYPEHSVQDWGLQFVRHVQHNGYEETWTPARRASASFIVQQGYVRGLTGMEHGQVIEVNPEVTSTMVGGRSDATSRWRYDNSAAVGGNLRWGLGSNFVLNGAVKPDFSQVEADALQIAGDARFALFYAEKRPFFVEGNEQFNVPNTLVYTRTISQPSAAAKLTGKFASSDVALLAAADDPQAARLSVVQDRPIIGILRLKRDFAQQSTAGILVSDREEGTAFNRVLGADMRHVFGGMYFAELQTVGSFSRSAPMFSDDRMHSAPMWNAVLDRTGRYFGFHYAIEGIGSEFLQTNGFVPRTNLVQPSIANRLSWYGKQGALLERYNVFVMSNALWHYDDFFHAKSMLENSVSANNSFTLRGGWNINATPNVSSYAFDAADYSGLYVRTTGPSLPPVYVPFQPSNRLTSTSIDFSISTPQFRRYTASVGTSYGHTLDFFETSRANRVRANASVDWRPTEQIRVGGSFLSDRYTRASDGRVQTTTRIPRLKVEYQLSRAIFVRFVGQYQAITDYQLVDPRSGAPMYRLTTQGTYEPARRNLDGIDAANGLRADWLFSYRPSPGTVFFLGYGSSLAEAEALRFTGLQKTSDGFFVKASYVFRR